MRHPVRRHQVVGVMVVLAVFCLAQLLIGGDHRRPLFVSGHGESDRLR
jgi:hypothetical protein